MNKYLVVDLLPSEWSKVTQWLLIPLSKALPGSNKLSRDLLEDRISTALRKPLNSQANILDYSETLEVLSQAIAQPSKAEASIQTEAPQTESIQPPQLDFAMFAAQEAILRTQIESLSREVAELKAISEAKDAQIAANSVLIQELQGKIEASQTSAQPSIAESAGSAVVASTLPQQPVHRHDGLSRVFTDHRVVLRVVGFLGRDLPSILAVSSVSRACRLSLSIHSLPVKSVLEVAKESFRREVDTLKRSSNRFQEVITPSGSNSSEFVQFLLFKYLEKQVKPAQVLEPTIMKSQQLINTINDETSSALFSESNGKPFDLEDEQDNIEKLKVLTLKQIESVLARQVYNKGEAPESILRMKKESYDKGLKKVQTTMMMFNQKLDKVPNIKMVAQQCFLHFTDIYFKVTFVISELQEMYSLKDYLLGELWNAYNQLEPLEHQLENLQITNQTLSRAKEFLYNRSNDLETKLNQANMELMTCREDISKLSSIARKLADEVKATRVALKSRDEDVGKAKLLITRLVDQKNQNEQYKTCCASIWQTLQSVPDVGANNRPK